jgi:hypothetical protein
LYINYLSTKAGSVYLKMYTHRSFFNFCNMFCETYKVKRKLYLVGDVELNVIFEFSIHVSLLNENMYVVVNMVIVAIYRV